MRLGQRLLTDQVIFQNVFIYLLNTGGEFLCPPYLPAPAGKIGLLLTFSVLLSFILYHQLPFGQLIYCLSLFLQLSLSRLPFCRTIAMLCTNVYIYFILFCLCMFLCWDFPNLLCILFYVLSTFCTIPLVYPCGWWRYLIHPAHIGRPHLYSGSASFPSVWTSLHGRSLRVLPSPACFWLPSRWRVNDAGLGPASWWGRAPHHPHGDHFQSTERYFRSSALLVASRYIRQAECYAYVVSWLRRMRHPLSLRHAPLSVFHPSVSTFHFWPYQATVSITQWRRI